MARSAALRIAGRPAVWLAATLIAGCATPPAPLPAVEPPAETQAETPAEAPVASAAQPATRTAARTRRALKPMPVKPLNVNTSCEFHGDGGYRGTARVEVASAEVRGFAASFDIPSRGSCHFDLAQFRQLARLPSVELAGPSNCRVRMWEQGPQVTVAFSNCSSLCSPGSAHDYVWPILIDRPSGTCD